MVDIFKIYCFRIIIIIMQFCLSHKPVSIFYVSSFVTTLIYRCVQHKMCDLTLTEELLNTLYSNITTKYYSLAAMFVNSKINYYYLYSLSGHPLD